MGIFKYRVLVFLVISVLLAFVWFRGGTIVATAEDGLAFYNPARTARLFTSLWWENNAPGQTLSISYIYAPLFLVSEILNKLFPNFVVQAFFYIFIFMSGMCGMYLFTKYLTKNKSISTLAGVFYLFNLYTMTHILFRSLYDGMYAWAYFPLYLYLVFNWLKHGKNLAVLLASSLVYVYTFAHPGFILLYFFAALLVFTFIFFTSDNRMKLIFRSVYASFLGVTIHIWWIYPMFTLAENTFNPTGVSGYSMFLVIEGASQSFPLQEVILLRERFYLGNFFDGWYKTGWLPISTSILILLFGIYGFFRTREFKFRWFLVSAFLITLFLAKGTNPPLGAMFYKKLFNHFLFAAAIRNPYEKIGLMLVVPYTIFFSTGIYFFYKKFQSLKARALLAVFIFYLFAVFYWPFTKGGIYPDYAIVRVPEYYSEVNDYLNSQQSDTNVLILPFVPLDSAVFNWGYRGVEPSRYMFDRPSLGVKVFSESIYDPLILNTKNNMEISSFLKNLNTSEIILRDDLDTVATQTLTAQQYRNTLNKTPGVSFVKKIGEVEIYKFVGAGGLFEIRGAERKFVYSKINKRDFVIDIENGVSPFDLVFKESFSSNWKAFINGQLIREHFTIDGFANAWRVNDSGKLHIELKYVVWPWE